MTWYSGLQHKQVPSYVECYLRAMYIGHHTRLRGSQASSVQIEVCGDSCCVVQVLHPLSVSYNKLGDLEYGQGNVDTALQWYQKGLAVREGTAQRGQQATPSQQLDVAVSRIKVADACQVLLLLCCNKCEVDLQRRNAWSLLTGALAFQRECP